MKKSTKLLSIIMALVMVITCIPFSATAATRNTDSLEAYLDGSNLGNVVESLLTDLNGRKEILVPTVLRILPMFVKDLKTAADANKLDTATATPEQLATLLLDYAEEALKKADLPHKIPDGTIKSVLKFLNIDADKLDTIDGVLGAVASVYNKLSSMGASIGDIGKLDLSSLTGAKKSGKYQPITRKSKGDLNIVYGVFEIIGKKDNIDIIKKLLNGKLTLGSLGTMLGSLGVELEDGASLEETINGFVSKLPGMIKEMVYELLLAEKVKTTNGSEEEYVPKIAYDKSSYALGKYTLDEMLAAALLNVMQNPDYFKGDADKKVVEYSKADCQKVAKMSLIMLLKNYGDDVVNTYALEPLNTKLREAINKGLDKPELKQLNDVLHQLINIDGYKFEKNCFNIAGFATDGIAESLNKILVNFLNIILTDDAKKAIALKDGSNDNIDANIKSLCKYILKLMAAQKEFYGVDFTKFTDAKLATMTTEEMAVEVLKIFYPQWFGTAAPADADSLEKMAAVAVEKAIEGVVSRNENKPEIKKIYEDALNAYKTQIYTNGKMANKSQVQYYDAMLTVAMVVAETELANANVGYSAVGGKWTNRLDGIINWALNFVKGLPAVAIDNAKGLNDLTKVPYGPFYKLNVLLNEILPVEMFTGVGSGTFKVDFEVVLLQRLLPAITDVSFGSLAQMFYKNQNANNPFNQSVLQAVVYNLDHIIFSLFEHKDAVSSTAVTKGATSWSDGYNVTKYDKNSGRYLAATKSESAHEVPTEAPTKPAETTTKKDETTTKKAETTTKKPEPTVSYFADPDKDGDITAKDARIILRLSAELEKLSDYGITEADVDIDHDNDITAKDARIALRVSAELEKLSDYKK